jgi:DNA topoisomerase-1
MGKSLVIVESKAKARTINQYLGKDFSVKFCLGHIRDLPKSSLGIDIANHFKPRYTISKDRKDIVDDLKESAKKADEVLLATDPDREGEAIAWHLSQILKSKNIKRIEFNEITKKAVNDALANPRDIDIKRVDAQQARRILDRLFGYSLSPYLWREIQAGLSAGRVQSVALRLICERESEIEKFVPQEYWTIAGLFKTQKGEEFQAELSKYKNEKLDIPKVDDVNRVKSDLEKLAYTIGDVKVLEKRRNPLPPFITSTLQQEASKRLKMPPKKTMQIAQRLYEGVKIGNHQVGLITYMRTDSFRVADEALNSVRSYIATRIGKDYLPEKPNFYATKRKIQDAHEAIRPTDMQNTPESLKNKLSPDDYALYELIWKRFIASQMAAGIDRVKTVIVVGGDYEFRASHTTQVFPGYRAIWSENIYNNDNAKVALPDVAIGESVELLNLNPEQHFTQPPPRYTSASLIKTLEELGIGRPSTYAPTVSILLDRNYAKREKGIFIPTTLGRQVDDLLVRKFPSILDYQFTAKMEDELDQIQAGAESWEDVVRNFYNPFYESLTKALGENCPKCSQPLILQNGPFGSYLACSNTECDYKKNLGEKEVEENCPECGKPLIQKMSRFGRFIGCSGYPECRYTQKIQKVGQDSDEKTPKKEVQYDDEPCPVCGARMILRSSARGRFFGCEKFPACKGTRSFKIGHKCPKDGCGGELVEKRGRSGKLFYSCSKYPDCDYVSFAHPLAGKGIKKKTEKPADDNDTEVEEATETASRKDESEDVDS